VRASGEKRSRSSFVIWLVLYESRPSMTIPDEPLTISMTRITFLQIGHRQQGSSTAYSDTTHCSSFKPFARLACPARVVAAQPQRREDLAAAVNCWFGVESSSASCACVMASLFTLPRRCPLNLRSWLSAAAVRQSGRKVRRCLQQRNQGRWTDVRGTAQEADRQPCGANAAQARTDHLIGIS
jgi:hypothetical protein